MLAVNRDYSSHDHRAKRKRSDNELDLWYRFVLHERVGSTLKFWIKLSQDSTCAFPSVAKIALNIFSIPAMSAECEGVFSETKRIITADRNQLGEATIEAIQ